MPVWAQMTLVLTVAVGGALLFVPLTAGIGAAIGGNLIDKPRPGEVQRRPISRTGGYGIVAAFLLALVVSRAFAAWSPRLTGLVLGTALLVPFAMWDDAKRLPPLPQLTAQFGCAALALASGVRLSSVSNPLGEPALDLGALAIPATLLWIVGMINAINMLDTMDGLAGGISVVSALVLAAATLLLGKRDGTGYETYYTLALPPLALAGACLGFLAFNFPPARIFMGTSGSMLLGYALGVLSIMGHAKVATALLVLGIPILDTALVIVKRLARRRSPLRGGDGVHLVHQLSAAGLSVRQIALLLYALTALFGALALVLTKLQKLWGFAGLILVIAALLLFLKWQNTPLAPLSDDKVEGQ